VAISRQSLPEVQSLIRSLVAKGPSITNDGLAANIALLIGYVAGNLPGLGSTLIDTLPTHVPFGLMCVGEIGSVIDLASRTELVDYAFVLVKSPDRRVFMAAAQSIGMMAVGSVDVIMRRLISTATDDTPHFAIWILSVYSLADKFVRNETALPDESFAIVTQYVTSNADYTKETAQTVAECLALLIQMKPDFALRLLDGATGNSPAGPVAMRAISVYLEAARRVCNAQVQVGGVSCAVAAHLCHHCRSSMAVRVSDNNVRRKAAEMVKLKSPTG
jgi:hypothetical protein